MTPSATSVAADRLATLRGVLEERSLGAILLSRTANKRYYAGFRLSDAEGPTSGYAGTLLVTRGRAASRSIVGLPT